MNERLDILLVEDQKEDADKIIKELNETKKLLEEWGLLGEIGFQDLRVEWISGSDMVNKRGKIYHHFSKADLPQIQKKVSEMKKKNPHTGILMDVILTKEEQERANINDFSKIEFSRELMDLYEPAKGEIKCGIYLTTALRNFGTLAWGIYGRQNMEQRYIPKDLIVVYPSRKAIAGMFYWLNNQKPIPEKVSFKIEKKELEEFL